MESESGLIFKKISSLANFNSRTKFKFTFNFLHIKLIGKGIQEKIYFNNIVSINQTYISRKLSDTENTTKPGSNLWLWKCQIVSEERLLEVPLIK